MTSLGAMKSTMQINSKNRIANEDKVITIIVYNVTPKPHSDASEILYLIAGTVEDKIWGNLIHHLMVRYVTVSDHTII